DSAEVVLVQPRDAAGGGNRSPAAGGADAAPFYGLEERRVVAALLRMGGDHDDRRRRADAGEADKWVEHAASCGTRVEMYHVRSGPTGPHCVCSCDWDARRTLILFGGTFELTEEEQRHGLQESLHAARLVEVRLVRPQRDLLLEQPIA